MHILRGYLIEYGELFVPVPLLQEQDVLEAFLDLRLGLVQLLFL